MSGEGSEAIPEGVAEIIGYVLHPSHHFTRSSEGSEGTLFFCQPAEVAPTYCKETPRMLV